MEAEEMAKNVDACYKNILEKFNPGARQLINAGKSYLKALHGAAAAAKIYLESLSKVAKQAQQGTCGGTSDIGLAMQQMIDVQREIQSQQINTLKAFYVDLIVPLESNIEKDTKVVQSDHKKFSQQYRSQYEVYSKALALVKKHGKKSAAKSNRSSASYDKEIKHLQTMEEEKAKLDAFCEHSLKEAITQERKRYGFVLERQTSLSKHFLAHYGKGAALLEKHLDGWQETSKAREELPACVEFLLGQQSMSGSDNLYALPRTPVLHLDEDSDNFCSASQMRKSQSVDASYLYEEANTPFTEAVNPKISAGATESSGALRSNGTNLCKSKSEYNLAFASPTRSVKTGFATTTRPKSTALPSSDRGTVRALYAYLSSGEHQINFLEGDLILLLGDEATSVHTNANGDRNKGWHYGENIRTGKRGWFPLAYTTAGEPVKDGDVDSGLGLRSQLDSSSPVAAANVDAESTTSGNSSASNSSSCPAPVSQTNPARKYPLPSSSALRPNSILFSKVPGFGKLRKSRSAFAERLLCPATTPSAPTASTPAAALPAGSVQQFRPSASTPTASSPALTTSNPSRLLLLSSKTAPPAPPPRHVQHSSSSHHLFMNSPAGADVSLRSSSDSGFVNDPLQQTPSSSSSSTSSSLMTTAAAAPPAPEVDYSDEDSLKLKTRNKLSRSLLDVTAQGCQRHQRGVGGTNLTMTLDRPRKAVDRGRPISQARSTFSRYPLPTMKHLESRKDPSIPSSSQQNDDEGDSELPPPSGRRSAGLFAKHHQRSDTHHHQYHPSMAKIKSKLVASGGFIRTALLRSRSKDSILDSTSFRGSTDTLLWQHKSTVPTYVGWRPPMPLPKDCSIEDNNNQEKDGKRRVPQRWPSRLSRRMFSSEADLLDVYSESGYMAIPDDIGRLDSPKQLNGGYNRQLHTLPRKKAQWNDDPSSYYSNSRVHFDLNSRIRKNHVTPRRSKSRDALGEQQLCDPWYDMWTSDPSSVRLCEIAQL